MIAAADTDLETIAARLVEVFELAEFTAADAKDIAGEGELSRLVAAARICEQARFFDGNVYTNQIPRSEVS